MNCSLSQATPIRKAPKIVVLGGGIAGLSVYASLKKLGFNVQVFERADKNRCSGMGFLMLQNGIETLDELGLKTSFKRISKKLENYTSFESADMLGVSTPLKGVYAVKRNEIVDLLECELNPEDIHYNKAFDHFKYEETGSVKAAVMTDGSIVSGDVFIAADGVQSKIRSTFFPKYKTEETDDHELVCVLPKLGFNFPLRNDLVKFLNSEAGVNMGLFRLKSNEVLWYLQFDKTKHGTPLDQEMGMEKFISKMACYVPHLFKKVLDVSEPEKCFYWKTRRMDLLPSFHYKNVLLIGDAAHPLLTFTSQGVNSALRDSIVLSRLFKNGYEDLSDLFTAFYMERKDEISRYIKEGDELLEQFSSAKFQGLPLVC